MREVPCDRHLDLVDLFTYWTRVFIIGDLLQPAFEGGLYGSGGISDLLVGYGEDIEGGVAARKLVEHCSREHADGQALMAVLLCSACTDLRTGV